MPRIPENVIQSVFYLYASKEDALAGINPGGTGFVVDVGSGFDPATGQIFPPHYYGVTNHHVACDGFPVVRLNTIDGRVDILDFNPDQWEFLPGKYDVAIIPLTLDSKVHAVHSISTQLFVEAPPRHNPYYIGDDVFMIGLFVDHAGTTTNVPSARFGNISMLPDERATLKQSTGYEGISYIVDMHSRTGFSGSPVFAYRTFGSDLTPVFGHRFDNLSIDDWGNESHRSGRLVARTLFNFLGIHWAQFTEEWKVRSANQGGEAKKRSLLVEGSVISGMSGMTCVIPAWQVLEVLTCPSSEDGGR
jgi:hypothetical protein